MSNRRLRASIASIVALATALVVSTVPVAATYPGENGRLAFGMSSGGGNVNIFSVRPDGTAFRQLNDMPGFNACPAYSSDGKSIAFCGGVLTGPGQGAIE